MKKKNKEKIQVVDKELTNIRKTVVSGGQATKPKKITLTPSQMKLTKRPQVCAEAQEDILRRLKNL